MTCTATGIRFLYCIETSLFQEEYKSRDPPGLTIVRGNTEVTIRINFSM